MKLTADQQKDANRKLIRRFACEPLYWVKAFFGNNIVDAQKRRGVEVRTETGLSLQQEDALRKWGQLLEAKILKMEGAAMTAAQEELSKKMGMSIMSSNGNGKDFLAALINWHFMTVFPSPHVVFTANTGKQLRNVYWSQLAQIRALAQPAKGTDCSELVSNYTLQNDRLFCNNLPPKYAKDDVGKVWVTEAVTISAKSTPEEQGEALAGRHNRFMLIGIDEASGLPDSVFKPLERTLTDPVNVVFMIFNPTRNTGYAIDSHGKNADRWVTLHWNALDCENISKDQIDRLRKYGEDSPAYRIGVLGLPPVSDENALIPFEWVQESIGRELSVNPQDPVIMGCDVGGGGDRSTIAIRSGGTIEPIITNNDKDTMQVASWITSQYLKEDAAVAVIDSNGLGAGVADRVRELNFMVYPLYGQGKSNRDEHYNKRAEMYFALRQQFENKAISLPDDPELINELSAIKFESLNNKNKIQDKREIRKALGFSPDKADALAMTYAVPDSMYRKGNHQRFSVDYSRFRSGII